MTLPVRSFCATQAVEGRAIHMGRPLTSKRTSTASAWRVAMATMVPFQRAVQVFAAPAIGHMEIFVHASSLSLRAGKGKVRRRYRKDAHGKFPGLKSAC